MRQHRKRRRRVRRASALQRAEEGQVRPRLRGLRLLRGPRRARRVFEQRARLPGVEGRPVRVAAERGAEAPVPHEPAEEAREVRPAPLRLGQVAQLVVSLEEHLQLEDDQPRCRAGGRPSARRPVIATAELEP